MNKMLFYFCLYTLMITSAYGIAVFARWLLAKCSVRLAVLDSGIIGVLGVLALIIGVYCGVSRT